MDQTDQKKYYRRYNWLKIYKCPLKDNMNNSVFHYFSEDLPGYQKTLISCSANTIRKPIKMYYEQQQIQIQKTVKTDDTPVIDFDYLQFKDQLPGKQIVVNRAAVINQSQWVKKYEPKSFIELLTDDKLNKDLLAWLKIWGDIISGKIQKSQAYKQPKTASIFTPTKNNMNKQRQHVEAYKSRNLILLAGPPGCGKTTLIRVIAKHCKFEVQQINASDDRSANVLIDKIENISGNETIRKSNKPTLICLDQVDGAVDSEANGLAKVLDFIENGRRQNKRTKKNNIKSNKQQDHNNKYHKKQLINLNRPIIFICNDPFVKGLKQLRSKAHVIYFSPLASERVVKRLKQICTKQKIYIENNVLQKICEICSNDIRGCIGILQMLVKQKKVSDRNPKDIIQKLRLSFIKDNEATINDFLSSLINRKKIQEFSNENKFIKIQRDVMQIGNPTLLLEYFYHNLLNIKGINRNQTNLLSLYDDMVFSSMLARNSFRYRNQLDYYHSVLYLNFFINFIAEQPKRLEFPSAFFDAVKRKKFHSDIFQKIYQSIPPFLLIFLNKKKIIGDYLYTLFLAMQAQTTKDLEVGKSVLTMLTYGFTFKRETDKHSYGPIFSPQIDSLLTFKGKKLQYLFSNSSKIAMQQNFEFYKHKKQLLANLDMTEATETMLNNLNLQSRKKRKNNFEFGLQYKFQEGTGTKITQKLKMKDFF